MAENLEICLVDVMVAYLADLMVASMVHYLKHIPMELEGRMGCKSDRN